MKMALMAKVFGAYMLLGITGLLLDVAYEHYFVYNQTLKLEELLVIRRYSTMGIRHSVIATYALVGGILITFLAMRKRLREQADLNFAILQTMPVAYVAVDMEGRVIAANDILQKVLELDKNNLPKKPDVKSFIPEEDWPILDDAIKLQLKGEITVVRIKMKTRSGEIRLYEWRGSIIKGPKNRVKSFIAIGIDITDANRAEMIEMRFGKFEAVDELASGIAHEFNNMLVVIMGNIQMAQIKIKESQTQVCASISGLLDYALNGCYRAAGLSAQLLAFAKPNEPKKEYVDVGSVVANAAKMAISGSGVELKEDIQAGVFAELDSGQISQVITNLVINARQAMNNTGKIWITCRESGDITEIKVRDNGIGISPEILDRIFDPFFTTKQSNGHGLGLSICRTIINKHDGKIAVESEAGKGTTFIVRLPKGIKNVCEISVTKEERGMRSLNVFVVDDDEDVLITFSLILEALKHRVVSVNSRDKGEEGVLSAFVEAEKNCGAFDLVFTDLIMPELSGHNLLKRLKELRSDARVVLVTGSGEDPALFNPQKFGFAAGLSKPYSLRELIKTIEDAML